MVVRFGEILLKDVDFDRMIYAAVWVQKVIHHFQAWTRNIHLTASGIQVKQVKVITRIRSNNYLKPC